MQRFIIRIVITFCTSLLLLEIVVRILSLAGHPLPVANVNGDYLLKPGESGYWIKGGFKEIASHYSINSQGWNSLRDYEVDRKDTSLTKIAIIGDSYIEGTHNHVEESIGNQLEQLLGTPYAVHEYGRSGGNIADFALIYEKFGLENYKYVFVLATYKDLIDKVPAFMTKGEKVPRTSLSRKIYDNCATLKYLNINHGLNEALKKLLKTKSSKEIKETEDPTKVNIDALNGFGTNTSFIYEPEKLPQTVVEDIPYTTIGIKHRLTPFNHGFDRHWNLNGRKNCAHAIAVFIKQTDL